MPKMIFVNLPVTDLARATAFYQAIGAEKNPQFCDDTASCMVFSETIYAMLNDPRQIQAVHPEADFGRQDVQPGPVLPVGGQPRRGR